MKRVFVVVVLAAVLIVAVSAAAFVHRLDQRTHGQYFDSNGVKIHYTVEGAGPPVILVHGFAVNGDLNWRRPGVIDALSPRYQVITLDNRGHGLSDKPHEAGKYGIEMVEDVIRLMDHLKIPKAHVVGYSMGGFMTLKLLTLHPDRLLSVAPCAAGWAPPTEKAPVLEALAVSLERRAGFGPLTRTLEPGGNPNWFKVWMTDRILMHLNDQAALAQVIRQFPEFTVAEEALRNNTVPVLSVVGSLDPLKLGIDRMKGILGAHEVCVIDNCDHITTMRDAGFVQALEDFLDRQTSAAPERAPAPAEAA
ncbi:MAG: alpha/beta hydrolase [Candidatus Hydrogenedentes bacterium]|nr:alpha/beta hydrolase [Candidatus Hydrogenedentota bacterium]